MKAQRRELGNVDLQHFSLLRAWLGPKRYLEPLIPDYCFVGCSISVTFVQEKDGKEITVQAPLGKHLLEVAHDNDIELEGKDPCSQQWAS